MSASDRNDLTFTVSRRKSREAVMDLVSDWYEIDRRAVGNIGAAVAAADRSKGRQGPTVAKSSGCAQWDLVDPPKRSEVERPAYRISAVPNVPSTLPGLGAQRNAQETASSARQGSGGTRRYRSRRVLHRWHLQRGQKGGLCVGKTKRGKGTKVMAIADRYGLPIAVCIDSASPHEVTLAEKTLDASFVDGRLTRLIGDKAYDSDPLDGRLRRERQIELIAPNRSNRKNFTQNGRPLRRYRRRWKVERLFAWLHNFRRLVTRYERHADNFLGFVQLGCAFILLRHL